MTFFHILKELITALENHNIWYRVVGGLAVDGLSKKLTRIHDDIDIIIDEAQLKDIQEIFGIPDELYPHKLLFYFSGIKVEMGRFIRNECRFLHHTWPKGLIKAQKAFLRGITFNVPSPTLLLSTRLEDNRKKGRHDKELLLKVGADIKVATRYKYTRQ
ncbi:MAG: hypothetical protein JRJ00_03805 [Deltaproteobacteria bacterium]|nr:hypothetical protein [Deltaproteobacteria bacterium]